MRLRAALGSAFVLAVLALSAGSARAADALEVGEATLDPPTLTALGVSLPITGDDDGDATVTVRYRKAGDATFRTGAPLFRVHPEVVTGFTVPAQFAGSVLDLAPGTTYEIELTAHDPDGGDKVVSISGTTRPVPSDPKTPAVKDVSDAGALSDALDAAKPGDVITLAEGTYTGNFAIHASGTAEQPIVIRGASAEDVVLDGGGCTGCNVLEVYGSFVHVERLTIRNASRALRFQGQGAEGDVVRRVHIEDVTLGIGGKPDQKNFYICDNVLEGRLTWPSVYTDDGGQHANDDGVNVQGEGHVVCHNAIHGFGDAIKVEQDGARAVDFYGNEITSAYDNGVELDKAQRNVRCSRNRLTNTYATMSFQPIYGGPVYAYRNVIVNVVNEQLKFHALGTTPPQEPSGMLVFHNTFVSARHALDLQTTATSHFFALENNLFVGPAKPDAARTVDWTGPIDRGVFDYDGYFPDGTFAFNLPPAGSTKFASFAEVQAAGIEAHGVLLAGAVFASGLTAPASYETALAPQDVTLAAGSNAIDRGVVLPNVNDAFKGTAPDLGALEVGCAQPIYGVRPEGVDETNEPLGCAAQGGGPTDPGEDGGAGAGADGGAGPAAGDGASAVPLSEDAGGCGCGVPRSRVSGAALAFAAAVLAAAFARRKRAR